MARRRVRSQSEVSRRCAELRAEVQAALARADEAADDPAVVDAIWRGEALGTLLWALRLAELPGYDRPFAAAELTGADLSAASLRPAEELELARSTARLWHWRARTSKLQAAGAVELPARYATFDQLIAATAMRGYDQGLLPAPTRGDFQAYGKVYRHLAGEQLEEAHSIALERHHALNWLVGLGGGWDDVPLDT